MEIMDKDYERKCFELAYLIFPDVDKTVEDLEIDYPERNTLKEGAIVTRIAPSPTGFMHTGNLFQALIHKKLSTQTDGVYFLRIEDTDQKREVEGAVKKYSEELGYFGLTPDEGVISEVKETGKYGPYVQSKRKDLYRICAKHLIEKGLAYPCFCTSEMMDKTRQAQEANKVVPGYYGVYAKCRNISIDESIERVKTGERYILRFRSAGSHLNKISFVDAGRGKIEMAENDQDVVILKSDGLPTYHFAHAVDDHFMRTTHVVRGEEWLPSTPIHIDLFNGMGFELPVYTHTPLILMKDGDSKRKLSKRKDKESAVSYFIKSGYPKEGVIEYLMTILNSDYELWKNQNRDKNIYDFEFKIDKMSSAGSLLDMPKLNDLCKDEISKMTSSQVLEYVLTWANEYSKDFYNIVARDKEYSLKVFGLERDNTDKIRKDIYKWEDVEDSFRYFFDDIYEEELKTDGSIISTLSEEKEKLSKSVIKTALEKYKASYSEEHTKDEWFQNMKDVAESIGFCVNMKEYKQSPESYIGNIADFSSIIRIAITNKKNTPDIYGIMQLLGKDRVIERLEKTIAIL